MKKVIIGLSTIAVLFSCSQGKKKITLKTEEDRVSYAIGLDIAKNFRSNKFDTLLNAEAISQGLIDGMAKDAKFLLNPDTAAKEIEKFSMKLREKQQAEQKKKYEKNIEIGTKFLEDNKKQTGVVTTASGLQYKIITKGTGKIPTANDVVKVHYKGTYIDGRVFDSSIERKEPATFPVSGGIIKGWSEVLQLMPIGSKWTVYIPQELAYGANDDGRIPIEPYSTLIFEIELLSIEKK